MRVKLKIVDKDGKKSTKDAELASAVRDYITDTYAEGAVERACDVAIRCAEYVGKLSDMLVEKGVLTVDEVKTLMPHTDVT